jgi:hypothetical protein
MLKRAFLLMCLLVCVEILFFPGCKTTDDASSDYTLTVIVGNGVSGTPAAGSTSYAENDTVSYNYSAQAGYGNLTVTLDGAPVASSGTVSMTANHTLEATADIDIRGTWSGTLYMTTDKYFEVTFSGGLTSGTATGDFDGTYGVGNGEFTLNNGQLEIELRFNRFGIIDILTCSGSFSDPNHLSGSYDWEQPGCGGASGNWELERN